MEREEVVRPEWVSRRMKKPSNSEPALCVGGNGSDDSGRNFESVEAIVNLIAVYRESSRMYDGKRERMGGGWQERERE